MGLTLTVPDEIARVVEEMSQRSGLPSEQLLLEALWAHFPPIPDELQAEFDALERASDEDFLRFEATLAEAGNATG